MVGTAGGGFDLMSEGLSLQGMMELPLVVHLAQRAGAATGVPTYTGQADLNVALYAGHGEFSRIVVAPADPEEAYEKTIEAFYLAEKFKTLSIILTDKHLVESAFTCNPLSFKESNLQMPKSEQFAGKGIFRKNGYEHDKEGNTTEVDVEIKKSVERRNRKIAEIRKEISKFTSYKVFGKGISTNSSNVGCNDSGGIGANGNDVECKYLLLGFGSTKGAVLHALPDLPDFSYCHLIYLEPFPEDIVDLIKKAEKVFVIEGNSQGQLAELITKKTGCKIENKILKYDGRPFTAEEITEEIKECLLQKIR
jgi:2-oxoglutarate ferredoxin oxidoreductase subunit alpha